MSKKLSVILEGVKRGDVASFELLYDMYIGKVLNYTNKIVANRALSEDIAQNCFVTVWERRASIDISKSFDSYMITITKNLIFDQMRKALLRDRYNERIAKMRVDYSNDTIEKIGHDMLQEQIDLIVEDMPKSMREIYILNSTNGLTAKEIAAQLAISPKSVETQLSRAKKLLRSKLSHFLSLFFFTI